MPSSWSASFRISCNKPSQATYGHQLNNRLSSTMPLLSAVPKHSATRYYQSRSAQILNTTARYVSSGIAAKLPSERKRSP